MNDSPFTAIGDEPVEARIVAWVLGEASGFEAAELERLCEERPELLVFRRRMRALHGLLTEAEASQPDEGWKLPEEKRKALDEVFVGEKPTRLDPVIERRIRHNGRRALLAIAACVIFTVVILGLMSPMVIRQRKKADMTESRQRMMMQEMEQAEVAADQGAGRNSELALQALDKAVRDQEDKVEEQRKVLATIDRTKGIIYKGNDSPSGRAGVADDKTEAIKRGLDAQDYAAAKREFEADQEVLQKLKVKLIEEKIANQIAQNEVASPAATAPAPVRADHAGGKPGQGGPDLKGGVDITGGTTLHMDADGLAKHEGAGQGLAKNKVAAPATPMVPLATDLPPELVEGTPKPINLPNLETPVNGPAGIPSLAKNNEERFKDGKPSSPSSSMAKVIAAKTTAAMAVPIPDVDVAAPSLDFGDGSELGTGWGGDIAARDDDKRSAPSYGSFATPPAKRVFAEGSESTIAIPEPKDSFGEIGALSSLSLGDSDRASGGGAGAGKPPADSGEIFYQSDEKSARKRDSLVDGNVPTLDDFESLKKSGAGTLSLSGGNTYAGGTTVTGGALNGHVTGFTGERAREDEKGGGQDARATVARASCPEPSLPAPIRTNPALTHEHTQNVDEVRRNLYMAEGNMNLGKYDDAKKEYENTLRVDPYNAAARRGLEKIAAAKSDYYRAAYDHTRAELLAQVDDAWEEAVPEDKGGKKANIEIDREFKYPTEYEPAAPSPKTAEAGGDLDGEGRDKDTSIVSGNRSGDSAITRNSIDAILNNPDRSARLKEAGTVSELKNKTDSLRKQLEESTISDSKKPKLFNEWKSAQRELASLDEGKAEVSESLLKAIRDQEDKVEERRKVLATIIRTKGIIYKHYVQSGVDEDQGAKRAMQMYQDFEQQKLLLESQLHSLEKYKDDQLMVYASGLDVPDNAIRKLYPKYLEERRELEAAKANGQGDNHPSVRAKVERIEAMKRELEESAAHLQVTKKAQLNFASERLKGVEAMKDESRTEEIKRGLDASDYVDAKKEFEKEQALLQQMKLKLQGARAKEKPAPPKPDLAKLMEEITAAEDPYSTFSLNISDASFKIAQASLAKGGRPDPAGVKVEQFYNAVDYGDPSPSKGEPVAVHIEQSAHPVIPGRNLVRVALKTAAAGRSASQPLRLTLLVDQSGSMVREDRRAAMDKALAGLGGLLTRNDVVTVVGFSRTPRLLADGLTGDKAGTLKNLVNQAASEGGTNLEEAIKLGGQMAERHKLSGAQNRIVLFTDGAANLGNADPVRLAEKVKALRQKGIAFDIAGIAADDLNDELLGELARNGNGRYYVVGKGDDGDFARQLAGAFRPAAENVKVQVHFNPERVARYKLIGFEKDRLKTEDFRNDAVDAAELAAEEAGVAIYQVEPIPGGTGELGDVSVRFRDAAAGQMVERTWAIPHDAGAPAIDRAPPSMQLAVLSMLAAEKLRGGPLGEAIDFKQLAEPRANVKRFYGQTGRSAEMLRMIDAIQ